MAKETDFEPVRTVHSRLIHRIESLYWRLDKLT